MTSNKYQQAVDTIIRHYFPDANFKAILGHEDDMPRKPDPSIVFKALMETARRACVESVGVSWGFRTIIELKEYLADHIISTPAQILDLLGE